MSFGPIRFLAVLSLLLAAALAWLWFDQSGNARGVSWTPPSALPPELAKASGSDPASSLNADPVQYVAILERPLFAPDRRPPPPPAPPVAAPPPDPLDNIQLSGIFTGADAGIIARVDGKTRRIKVNESIGAWTLKSVSGRDVTFAQGSDSRQLRLNYSRLGPPVVQAAAPGSATAQVGTAPGAGVSLAPNPQDEARERLRRRNEIRAARGLPLITE